MKAIEIVAAYGLYALSAAILIWRYGTKDRLPLMIVAWLLPPMTIAALLHSAVRLIFGKRPRVQPCPHGLEAAERLVEIRRRKMFGGELREPHFAHDWGVLYRITLEEEAAGVQRIARRVLTYA